jgi:hypothetical protein
MYGLWILVIIFGVLGIACIIPAAMAEPMYRKYRNQLYYKYEKKAYYGQTYIDETRFDGSTWDKEQLSEEEFNRLQKIYRKYKFWDNLYCSDAETTLGIIGTLCLVAVVIITAVAIMVPIEAMEEVAYWQEFKPMAENIINSSDSYQSRGITDKIIEYNTWFAEARTSQEIWKNWSMYYNVDLSGLDYIVVGGK